MSYLLYLANIYTKRYKRDVTEGFTQAALLTRSGIKWSLPPSTSSLVSYALEYGGTLRRLGVLALMTWSSGRGARACLYRPVGWTRALGSNRPWSTTKMQTLRRWRNRHRSLWVTGGAPGRPTWVGVGWPGSMPGGSPIGRSSSRVF
jgi:hypothetical protein